MKTGTTSLQHYLECHPELSLAPKELNFFSKNENWQRGLGWYQQHFQENKLVQGEVSPGYSKCHLNQNIPERIHSIVPDVKIIYVLREPFARLISHLSHAIGEDSGNLSQDQVLAASLDNFVNTSRYMAQLDHYLRFFDLDQILIITSEKLRDERRATLQQIFNFLEVDDSFSSEAFEQIRHDSSVKVRRNVLGRVFARHPVLKNIENRVKSAVPQRWYPFLARAVGKNFSKPFLSPRQKSEIAALLREDLQRLKQITRNEFREWQ